MTFQSILFREAADRHPQERPPVPEFFVDLNLDQIVAAVASGKEEYDLKPFFHMPLRDADAIAFRHEVMRELEDVRLFESVKAFAEGARTVRKDLEQAEKVHYERQKQRWFLDAVDAYCDAVTRLFRDLSSAQLASRGFSAFREYLTGYARSGRFTSLAGQTKKLKADLASVRYCVLIDGLSVQARKYQGEPDYSMEVEATFARFRQGAVQTYEFKFYETLEMNPVESKILDLVVELYPEVFSELEEYCTAKKDFIDPEIARFDREIEFYVTYLEHIAAFKQMGLRFCYPQIAQDSKEVYSEEGFDLALAGKLLSEREAPVCNDFRLQGPERIIVVTGPNQGGKTTLARMFGQLHYLASLGCPVPGAQAQLYLFDRLLTHFEREESSANLRGKLQDDLVRIHAILESATPRSIVIVNEIFASTTFRDARSLSRKIAFKLAELDLLCVWVTFIDELASLSEKTVSMVSSVVPENPALRTYKVVRRPADGLAYALALAEKYRLTRGMIRERIAS